MRFIKTLLGLGAVIAVLQVGVATPSFAGYINFGKIEIGAVLPGETEKYCVTGPNKLDVYATMDESEPFAFLEPPTFGLAPSLFDTLCKRIKVKFSPTKEGVFTRTLQVAVYLNGTYNRTDFYILTGEAVLPETLTLEDVTISEVKEYRALRWIRVQNVTLTPNADVLFSAGDNVTLVPGFHAEEGSQVLIEIRAGE